MSSTQLRNIALLVLVVVALASSLITAWRTRDWGGLALNLSTEIIGAIATYGLFELFIGRRERREAEKADLIAQMGSTVKDVAIAAAEELRRHSWLRDGSLKGKDLSRAQLPGAILAWADLQGANLRAANLQGANLYRANLQGADLLAANLQEVLLIGANLQGAILAGANLQEANLLAANLQEVLLIGANLQGAKLRAAKLQGAPLAEANLQDAEFDADTTLPDGTNWTPGTDMARFTDPDHPAFWCPEE